MGGCVTILNLDGLSSGDAGVADSARDVTRARDGGSRDAGSREAARGSEGGKDGAADGRPCQGAACPDAGPPATSCAGAGGAGLTDCPAGSGQESCCVSLDVEGGTYYRSYQAGTAALGVCAGGVACDGGTEKGNPATVSSFRLDKYLVTVGRFRRFREAFMQEEGIPAAGAGRHTHLNGGSGLANSGSAAGYEPGWLQTWNSSVDPTDANLECGPDATPPLSTWTPTIGTNESLPMGCANWWEAYAFCIWDGAFLPSEAEWEYAAAGGSDQRPFPWGATDPGMSQLFAVYGNSSITEPVGSAPEGAARWGQLDMAGDAYEWVLDYFAPYVDPCADCADLGSEFNRSLRTQHYGTGTEYLAPPYRSASSPFGRNFSIGFRCARVP